MKGFKSKSILIVSVVIALIIVTVIFFESRLDKTQRNGLPDTCVVDGRTAPIEQCI